MCVHVFLVLYFQNVRHTNGGKYGNLLAALVIVNLVSLPLLSLLFMVIICLACLILASKSFLYPVGTKHKTYHYHILEDYV